MVEVPSHSPGTASVSRPRRRPGGSLRLQSLMVAGAAVVALPVLIRQAAAVPAVALLVLVAVGSIGVWWTARTGQLPGGLARRAPAALIVVAFAMVVVVLGAVEGRLLVAFVPLVGALVAALSTLPGRPQRWCCQAGLLVVLTAAFVLHDRPVPETVFVVVLLASIALIAELFTTELVRARAAEADARRTAERRAELLQTARGLPGTSVEVAAEAVVGTLRSLAFDAAGVAVVRDGLLDAIHLDGIPDVGEPLERGRGVSWEAIERDETIVLDDYRQAPQRLSERPTVRSTVVTPIRVDGQPVGTVMCARAEPASPSDAEVEIAEVLADHLGGVFAAAQRNDRQRELLARVEGLDRMRTGLVDAVSAELRDPLTIVRGIASILRVHGDRLPPGERRVFLDRLGAQTTDLRRVVDAILEFSRFQAQRRAATVVDASLVEVLAPLLSAHEVDLRPSLDDLPGDLTVQVDPQLLRFGLQLLVEPRLDTDGRVRPVRLDVVEEDGSAILVRRQRESPPVSVLTVSLAAQLLVAAGATVEAGGDGGDTRVRLPGPDGEVAG